MIPALVLTAGLATRLRPLSLVRAKAALPVAGEPLVRRILRALAAAGVTDAVLNLHHRPHTLTAVVGDGSDLGLRVRYSWEVPLLGSAGGPARAVPLMDPAPLPPLTSPRRTSDMAATHQDGTHRATEAQRHPGVSVPRAGGSFLIVNGDTLTDVDVRAVAGDHRQSGALVTLAVTPNPAPEKYSGLAVDAAGCVTGLVPRGGGRSSFHFLGVQVAEPDAFASVPPGTPYESVATLYPALIATRPGSVRAFETRAEFFDIGTPGDYLNTALLLADREGRRLEPGTGSRIHESARIERSLLWDRVTVGEGAFLRECIVTDDVEVPADTSWHGVTIRRAEGEIVPGERRIDGLAVSGIGSW